MSSISDLEKTIHHVFKDKSLIETALTHASSSRSNNYERIEFLGDRVLGLIIAEYLYKHFPKEQEGALAKRLAALVQGSMLAEIAQDIDLGQYIQFSESEKAAGGADNMHLLADVFESMIGALYLDAGFEPCRILIEKYWADRFDKMVTPPMHPKTTVQEWAQSQSLPLPLYTIIDQTGPDHAPIFIIELSIEGFESVRAQGKSRQAAEKESAIKFIKQHIKTADEHE